MVLQVSLVRVVFELKRMSLQLLLVCVLAALSLKKFQVMVCFIAAAQVKAVFFRC
jgi:hypothetical protein